MAKLSPIKAADEWFQGETKLFDFTVETEEENGTPQDVTGWALRWQIMAHKRAQDTLLEKSTGGSGVVITDGPSGVCEVTVDPTDTTVLEPKMYWHELWRTDAGFETVLSYGPAELL